MRSNVFQKGYSHLKSITLLIIVVLLGVFVQGCTEDPTSVGLSLLRPQDFPAIKDTTYPASSFSTIRSSVQTSGSDRILLGRASAYDAILMLRFTGLTTGLLDTVTITGSRIELRAIYHFADSLAPLAFSVYPAIAPWDTVSYDSLTQNPGNYYSSNPYSVVAPLILGDTSRVQFAVDTAAVRTWFAATANNGVILRASNVGTIKGFGSFVHPTTDYRPRLIVDYVKGGTPGSFTLNSGDARFVANVPQTNLVLNPELMYIQSGVAFRGVLNFNLTSLPKEASILRADLELTLKTSSSIQNSYLADSLYSYYVFSDGTVTSNYVESKTVIRNGNRIYQLAIRPFVRQWTLTGAVQSLQFSGKREGSSLDHFAIYGTGTSIPDSLRPRLILTYAALTQ
jgi:hypothetical protein